MAGGLANDGGSTDTSDNTDDDAADADADDSNTDGGNTDGGDITTCDDVIVNSAVNPFAGKNFYVNPTYQTNLDTSIASASGTTKANL
jgi:hypothetical protein